MPSTMPPSKTSDRCIGPESGSMSCWINRMTGRCNGAAARQVANLYAVGDAEALNRLSACRGSACSARLGCSAGAGAGRDNGPVPGPTMVAAKGMGPLDDAVTRALQADSHSGENSRTGTGMSPRFRFLGRRRRSVKRARLVGAPISVERNEPRRLGSPVRFHSRSGSGCRTAVGPAPASVARRSAPVPSRHMSATPSVTTKKARRWAASTSSPGRRRPRVTDPSTKTLCGAIAAASPSAPE